MNKKDILLHFIKEYKKLLGKPGFKTIGVKCCIVRHCADCCFSMNGNFKCILVKWRFTKKKNYRSPNVIYDRLIKMYVRKYGETNLIEELL